MFEKHVLIIWQPSINFLAKKWISAYLAFQTPLSYQFSRNLEHWYDYSDHFKNAIHKVLTLNGRQIKSIDQKLNSKGAWKAHRSVVLRMFWLVLIDLTILPLGLRTPYRQVFDLK